MCITSEDIDLMGRVLLPKIKRLVEDELRLQLSELKYLKQEVDRLKAGRFTEEELQNLCHALAEQDEQCPRRFAEGCVVYNKKLFGDRSRLYMANWEEP